MCCQKIDEGKRERKKNKQTSVLKNDVVRLVAKI